MCLWDLGLEEGRPFSLETSHGRTRIPQLYPNSICICDRDTVESNSVSSLSIGRFEPFLEIQRGWAAGRAAKLVATRCFQDKLKVVAAAAFGP